MPNSTNVSHWIDQVKLGDSVAANQLWHHYYDRLVRMTQAKLRGQNRGVSDEEDIVLSVFESFYRAAEQGRFPDLAGRDDLWRLLLKMSARKVVDKRRHDQRQRRGATAKVQPIHGIGDEQAMIEVIGNEPTPEMVLMMTESFDQLLKLLGDEHVGGGQLQEIAIGKMEGHSNADLAERMQCSERTIERRLNLIREKCRQELIDRDEPPT
ncbi:ECF-type sigma factor [Novipirellula artificiosorum]|uniref:ECF sigma factor n=1 Tax=Novipirellula artificiosorum TaxID=2528016 RepID=A0A5C6DTN9_9BACT|nr:ECF-type sigma factor [Novipirellula artificiosorum]TWU38396.1 ECF sigma factor [Novipirellula artificiosorum]